jgi:hypothetical protein
MVTLGFILVIVCAPIATPILVCGLFMGAKRSEELWGSDRERA